MDLTLQNLLEEGTDRLFKAGIGEAEIDAKYLLFEAFQTDMTHFLLDRSRRISDKDSMKEAVAQYRGMIEKREERIPLQQITGTREFMGLEFYVNQHVLIPRQDTETMVELILKDYKGKNPNILDMCTGSGCIAISLAVLGGFREITAVDVSKKALRMALKNVRSIYGEAFHGTSSLTLHSQEPWRLTYSQKPLSMDRRSAKSQTERRLTLVKSDLFQAFSQERFDVIVSNPPYIPTEVIAGLEPEVRDHEPMLALDGKEDGLYFYRRLAKECSSYLKPDGTVYFEIGHDQGEAVSGLLKKAGFKTIRVVKDAGGLDRVVLGVLS